MQQGICGTLRSWTTQVRIGYPPELPGGFEQFYLSPAGRLQRRRWRGQTCLEKRHAPETRTNSGLAGSRTELCTGMSTKNGHKFRPGGHRVRGSANLPQFWQNESARGGFGDHALQNVPKYRGRQATFRKRPKQKTRALTGRNAGFYIFLHFLKYVFGGSGETHTYKLNFPY